MDLHMLVNLTNFEHSRKVSGISRLLAKNAGYSSSEVEMIAQAALYHDIGKCDIPPEILNKPGALTDREFRIIKTHTRLGSEKIKAVLHILLAAYLIAEYHHERWDGTGYRGLSAQEIHPYARLVSVADVFDALVSKRAYKDAWDRNEVLRYLKNQSGIQFDEDFVSILLSHSDEIMGLYEK